MKDKKVEEYKGYKDFINKHLDTFKELAKH